MHPTDEPERLPIKAPTLAQREYAADLVERLGKENATLEAGRYSRAVERCYDRRDMSRLISEMVEALEQIRAMDRDVRFPKR